MVVKRVKMNLDNVYFNIREMYAEKRVIFQIFFQP